VHRRTELLDERLVGVSSGLLPYAPQKRLNFPVSASITATRLLP